MSNSQCDIGLDMPLLITTIIIVNILTIALITIIISMFSNISLDLNSCWHLGLRFQVFCSVPPPSSSYLIFKGFGHSRKYFTNSQKDQISDKFTYILRSMKDSIADTYHIFLVKCFVLCALNIFGHISMYTEFLVKSTVSQLLHLPWFSDHNPATQSLSVWSTHNEE